MFLARIGGGEEGGDAVVSLQENTMDVLDQMGGRQIANVMHSMAQLPWVDAKRDRGLLEAMQRRATDSVEEFNPQDVANVLWALAVMGEKVDRGLLDAMQGRATATAGDFAPHAIANVLWALAVMGEGGSHVLIDRLAARVFEVRHQLTLENKSQLHLWLLSCELDLVSPLEPFSPEAGPSWTRSSQSGASLSGVVALVKQEMGEELLQAFSGQAMHDKAQGPSRTCNESQEEESRLQKEVAAVLRSSVWEVEIEEEYVDARSGYSIDVVVRRGSVSYERGTPAGSTGVGESLQGPAGDWAVEVDGPTHFLGDGRTPSGSTLLKRKQLSQVPSALNPQPSTLNPQPSTLNPQPSTLNPEAFGSWATRWWQCRSGSGMPWRARKRSGGI